jgi:type II secretory pathway component PulJ
MHLMRRRDEEGATVAELAITALVASIALAFLAAFLVSTFGAGIFAEGQVATINDARNAMMRMEKEIRGADSIEWCSPPGSCLVVGAQTPLGGFRTVRYRHNAAVLERQEFNPSTSTWSAPQTIVERVGNTGSQPVFACDTQSTFLRVNIDLHIEPTPDSDPKYNIHTSVRPRNFPSKASCP